MILCLHKYNPSPPSSCSSNGKTNRTRGKMGQFFFFPSKMWVGQKKQQYPFRHVFKPIGVFLKFSVLSLKWHEPCLPGASSISYSQFSLKSQLRSQQFLSRKRQKVLGNSETKKGKKIVRITIKC